MLRNLAAVALTLAAVTVTPAEAIPRLVPAADREIVFTADGTTAYGTLHVPEHRTGQRLRAALLLPGSGPSDRDGNQPPASSPDILAQLAEALDGDGIATLRFDKYGTGRTGVGVYRSHPEQLDYPAFVRQARADPTEPPACPWRYRVGRHGRRGSARAAGSPGGARRHLPR